MPRRARGPMFRGRPDPFVSGRVSRRDDWTDRPFGPTPGSGATVALLARARSGDAFARETLFGRFLPIVRRWARYRLPHSARGLADTDDLVQITLMRALNRLEHSNTGARARFWPTCTILLNVVREEIRRARPIDTASPFEDVALGRLPARSELEQLIGRETLERSRAGAGGAGRHPTRGGTAASRVRLLPRRDRRGAGQAERGCRAHDRGLPPRWR